MRLPDPQRSRVVLIGTTRYRDAKLPDLPAVQHSLTDLAATLTNPISGIVGPEHCSVLLDEGDLRELGRQIREQASAAEDLLVVYYVGHGLVGGGRHDLYLALCDSELDAPEYNSLEYDKLRGTVLQSPATNKIVILDCCFSGRALADAMADPATVVLGQLDVQGTYVLTSAPRDRVALSLAGERHTAFTGRLIKLLQNGIVGESEFLSIESLYGRLRSIMRAEALPLPEKRATRTAELIALGRNRAFTFAGPRHDPVGADNRDEGEWGAAMDVAREVEADRRQRAVDRGFTTRDEAAAARAALARALYPAEGASVAPHVRPWVWTTASSGKPLTEHGRRTGIEIRLSYYADGQAKSAGRSVDRVADVKDLLKSATRDRDRGALDEAEAQYRRALELAVGLGARKEEGRAWDGLGSCRWRKDDPEAAIEFFTIALDIARQIDDIPMQAWGLHNSGLYQQKRGDAEAAEDFFNQALALAGSHWLPAVAGWTYHQLAELARDQGDLERERVMYESARRVGAATDDSTLLGWSLNHLADCALESGRSSEAAALYRQALVIGRRATNYGMIRHAEEALARSADEQPERD
ncbi:tetratricopeptide repeat protein [Streptosporangiaceae bacterium NEAU-GS5]|nr:tetratricopeptide repeat protein [Streptosporangiaceae bacterium NEAU-GS5]